MIPIPDASIPDSEIVTAAPIFTVFLNVDIPATSKIPVLTLSVAAIPVKFAPLTAGRVAGNLASGIVPDVSCVAFKAVNPDPFPVAIPVKNTSPSLLKVIPLPTTIPFHAVTRPTASILVTSS